MKSKGKIGKMLICMIFLAVMICIIPTKSVHAVVHDGTTPEGFNYLKSMGCVYISGYEGTETDIEIPEYFTIDGKKYTVIGIWNGAFSPSHADVAITSVTIPDTVQYIQPYAFSSTNIKTITIPKSVDELPHSMFDSCYELEEVIFEEGIDLERIWDYTFNDCRSLRKIEIPDGVEIICAGAFNRCASLGSIGNEFILPDSVREIKDCAFAECTSLRFLSLPDKLTELGYGVFQGCTSLTHAEIPIGIKEIKMWTFEGCTEFGKIYLYNTTKWIEPNAFYGCEKFADWGEVSYFGTEEQWAEIEHGIEGEPGPELKKVEERGKIFFMEGLKGLQFEIKEDISGAVITGYTGTETEVEIPREIGFINVTEIADSAFANKDFIKSVTIPDTVTKISEYAFFGCSSLEAIEIPDRVTTMEYGAFMECSSLKSAILSDKLTELPEKAFYKCSSLAEITIPDNITKIGDSAFEECINLTKVDAPSKLTEIGYGAFKDCKALKGILLPDCVTTMGMDVFMRCTSLESFTVPNSLKEIPVCAFFGCTSLKVVDIPNGVTDIYDSAFHNCKALTKVNYGGTAKKWAEIYIEANNDPLKNTQFEYSGHDCNYIKSTFTPGTDCSQPGIQLYVCETCKVKMTEVVPAPGHEYDNACDADCNVCKLTRETKHVYDNDCDETCNECAEVRVISHAYSSICDTTCNICGEKRTIEHAYKSPCAEECRVCGEKRTPPHKYKNDCASRCELCPHLREARDHQYDNDCDNTCNSCGVLRTVEGHKYDNDCDTTCNSCGAVDNARGHKYDNDCDADCNVCGKTRNVEGHKYEWVIDKNSKCGYEGKKHEECITCGTTRNENTVIPPTGNHTYTNDCDKYCNVCNFARDNDHKYEWVVITEATCKTKGKQQEQCSVCGGTRATKDIAIDSSKHVYDYSCDKDCNVCGKTRIILSRNHKYDGDCDAECNNCGAKRTASSHKYEWVIDKSSTCGADGYKHEECIGCYAKRNENKVIPATGNHTYDNDKDTTCNVCGDVRNLAHSHTYDNNCDATCNVCGATRTVSHDFKAATCTEAKKCKVCGITEGLPTEHSYGTYKTTTQAEFGKDGVQTAKCETCTAKITKPIAAPNTVKLSAASYTYNGKAKKPTVKAVYDSKGNMISSSSYTVSYASGRKNVGKYKVTVTFKNTNADYEGSSSTTFTINPKGTSISKLSKAKKSFTVKWKKQATQTTGYQIRYSTSSKMTSAKSTTVSKNKTTSKTIKKLKAKKKYYVQIRTYKTVKGVKYYSSWSKVKKVKTK